MLVTGSGAGGRARKAHPRSPACGEGAVMGGGSSSRDGLRISPIFFLCPFVFPSCFTLCCFSPPL